MTIMWFGDPWPSAESRAEICKNEDTRVLTPQGRNCLYCSEAVLDGERGVVLPAVVQINPQVYEAAMEVAHIECFVRMALGSLRHLQGRCSCFGGPDTRPVEMSARDEAREVFDYTLRGGTF